MAVVECQITAEQALALLADRLDLRNVRMKLADPEKGRAMPRSSLTFVRPSIESSSLSI